MRWLRAAFLTSALAGLAPPLAAAAPRDTDSQLWTELDLDVPVASRLNLSGLAVLRAGDGLPNPTLVAAGGGLSYTLTSHWSVAAGDYWVQARSPASGQTIDLQLPLAAVTYGVKIGGFAITDRNRAERIVGLPGETWRYRNRLVASHPVAFGPVRSVFVADEVFYDFSRGSFSRNRAQAGVGLGSVGPASLQFYYLRQDDCFSHPGHLNVLGVALALRFGRRG